MKKLAILVVSFGTIHMETCSKTLDAIEEDIRQHYTSYPVYRAWTNTFVRNKFEKLHGIHICSVSEVLEQMLKNGVKKVVVQPTYVVSGLEFQAMQEELDGYREQFEDIQVGSPLLTSDEDLQKVATIIGQTWKHTEDKFAVYMGHGTEHSSNDVYSEVNKKIKVAGYSNIMIGTMHANPSIMDVIHVLKELNINEVILSPFMIVAGSHAINNLAGDRPDSWKSILESEGFEVQCMLKGLGEYEGIRQIFIEHLEENFKKGLV